MAKMLPKQDDEKKQVENWNWEVFENSFHGQTSARNFILRHSVLEKMFGQNTCANLYYTKNAEDANQWIDLHIVNSEIQSNIIGFDTESNPWARPQYLCLMQIAILKLESKQPDVLLFHFPQKTQKKLPDLFKLILENPKYVKCGVAISGDDRLMKKRFGVGLNNIFDIMTYTNKGLKNSMSHFLEVDVPKYKQITVSQWANNKLKNKQIMYGALDAIYGAYLTIEILNKIGDMESLRNHMKDIRLKKQEEKKLKLLNVKLKYEYVVEALEKESIVKQNINQIADIILRYHHGRYGSNGKLKKYEAPWKKKRKDKKKGQNKNKRNNQNKGKKTNKQKDKKKEQNKNKQKDKEKEQKKKKQKDKKKRKRKRKNKKKENELFIITQ